jgi:hypothetical protein
MSHDRQKQSSLDRFLVKVKPGELQPGPTREKRQKREREKHQNVVRFLKFYWKRTLLPNNNISSSAPY